MLLPLLRLVEKLSSGIKNMTRGSKNWPPRNMRIRSYCDGEGSGSADPLAYVLTLENPQRFVQSRDVGPIWD